MQAVVKASQGWRQVPGTPSRDATRQCQRPTYMSHSLPSPSICISRKQGWRLINWDSHQTLWHRMQMPKWWYNYCTPFLQVFLNSFPYFFVRDPREKHKSICLLSLFCRPRIFLKERKGVSQRRTGARYWKPPAHSMLAISHRWEFTTGMT